MSLFDDQAGVAGAVFSDLFTISGSDLGLGESPVTGDTTVQQVTYAESAGQPATADRLNNLVNGAGPPPNVPATPPIVITALNGGNDPHSGQDVTGNGFTYVDRTGTSPVIRAVYDVSDCNGQGIQVFDAGGNLIAEPRTVILYHELSHAFHFAIGQLPFPQSACPGNPTDEPAAEIDENVLRTQLGLPLRDPCNHDGQCGGGPTNSCFTGDTRITLADHEEKPIDTVREGDLVLGRCGRANRVIGIERPFLGERKLFSINGSTPFVTAEHPIMTATGWKSIDPQATAAENPRLIVGRLLVNDVLMTLEGSVVTALPDAGRGDRVEPALQPVALTRLDSHRADRQTQLYNLLLDGDHTYFANGLLVHNKCFIVTAATGSADSEELVALRALRERVCQRSAIAAALIDAVYNEYWQFSPAVARRLDADSFARQGALLGAVRPLLAWYHLAGQLAFEHGDVGGIACAVDALRQACPRWMSPQSIADRIAALRRGEPVSGGAAQMLRELAPHLYRAASLPLVDWAVLQPLEMCWATIAQRRDPVVAIARWLGDAPVDRLAGLPADASHAHADAVAALLAFSPADQQRLLRRLEAVASAMPDTARP